MNMWAVALDVQGVGNCFQIQNIYRNISHRNLNKGELKKVKIFNFQIICHQVVTVGEVLRQFLVPQNFHADPHHILHQGEEDSTHLALTDRGREVVDTITVMQLPFISHNMEKDSTCLDCEDTFLQAFLSNSLGKHEGAECYCGLCGNRTENNDHLGIHIQVGHGLKWK